MRQIGIIPDPGDARRFGDYLTTRGITSRIDDRPGGSSIWVHREDAVDEARRALADFQADPTNDRYRDVRAVARTIQKEKAREDRRHMRFSVSLNVGVQHRPIDRVPATILIVGASIVVAVMTQLGSLQNRTMDALSIAPAEYVLVAAPGPVAGDPDADAEPEPSIRRRIAPRDGLAAVRSGQVWRLVTPILIHFGILHLLFNLVWVLDLGGMVELRKGTIGLVALVLIVAVASNLSQYLQNGPYFGGLSGVVFGLFGFVWVQNRLDPRAGMPLRPNTAVWFVIWFFVCLAGVVGPVANMAHLAGGLSGAALGVVPVAWRRLRGLKD